MWNVSDRSKEPKRSFKCIAVAVVVVVVVEAHEVDVASHVHRPWRFNHIGSFNLLSSLSIRIIYFISIASSSDVDSTFQTAVSIPV